MTIFYCLRFENPQPGGVGPRICIPQEQGGPIIPPVTGFPFRHLLRLAGLRWRHSTRLHTESAVPGHRLSMLYSLGLTVERSQVSTVRFMCYRRPDGHCLGIFCIYNIFFSTLKKYRVVLIRFCGYLIIAVA
jgi:hypothetical protein